MFRFNISHLPVVGNLSLTLTVTAKIKASVTLASPASRQSHAMRQFHLLSTAISNNSSKRQQVGQVGYR